MVEQNAALSIFNIVQSQHIKPVSWYASFGARNSCNVPNAKTRIQYISNSMNFLCFRMYYVHDVFTL